MATKDDEIAALRDKLKDLTRVHHSTLTELRKQVGGSHLLYTRACEGTDSTRGVPS